MQTWLGPDVVALLDRHMPADWRSRLIETDVLDQISAIPDDEFWHAHVAAKHRLVSFVRQRARQRSIRRDVVNLHRSNHVGVRCHDQQRGGNA